MFQVPLISADLSPEEAALRIVEATKQFNKMTEAIFGKIEARANGLDGELNAMERRANGIRDKIAHMRQTSSAAILHAPSHFPVTEYEMGQPVLTAGGMCSNQPAEGARDGSSSALFSGPLKQSVVDVKQELNEKKQFFSANQIYTSTRGKTRKSDAASRKVPSSVKSVVDLFYAGTDRVAYDGIIEGEESEKNRNHSRTVRQRKDEKGQESGTSMLHLDSPAIGAAGSNETQPFAYENELPDVDDLELPDVLPELPDIAFDITLSQETVKFRKPTNIEKAESSPKQPEAPDGQGDTANSSSSAMSSVVPPAPLAPPPPAPIVPPVVVTPAPPSSNLPPIAPPTMTAAGPPPPPPPPPPPALLMSPPSSSSTPTTPSGGDGRMDLMASIRAAGGVGKAALKRSAGNRKTNSSTSSSLNESSALSSNKAGSSGTGEDLMTSLSKALDARRRAISGKRDAGPPSGGLNALRNSPMIPAPPLQEEDKDSGSGVDDWA